MIAAIINNMKLLLKKGHPGLTTLKADYTKLSSLPKLSRDREDEVLGCIDDCKETLRNLEGFWEGRGMSIASTQIGSDLPLFVMCHYNNWYKPNMYRKF